MVMNISCKFEKASYNIFFVRAVTVKSLYTLRRQRRNEVKSIVSTGCYPVDTIKCFWFPEFGLFSRQYQPLIAPNIEIFYIQYRYPHNQTISPLCCTMLQVAHPGSTPLCCTLCRWRQSVDTHRRALSDTSYHDKPTPHRSHRQHPESRAISVESRAITVDSAL